MILRVYGEGLKCDPEGYVEGLKCDPEGYGEGCEV